MIPGALVLIGLSAVVALNAANGDLSADGVLFHMAAVVPGLPDIEEGAIGAVLFAGALILAASSLFALVTRLCRSRGEERQQLIQMIVDRRFNRSRYDAEQAIESFGARLRNEVELDALAAGLITVVNRTMARPHVSLWISPERRS